MRLLGSLYSHVVLISAKKSIGAPTKVKLNIYHSTLAKLVQERRHESVTKDVSQESPRVPGSIPIGGNFFAGYILLLPTQAFIANIVVDQNHLF